MKNTVLVTGANYGHTDFAIAERFAKEGYDAVITCRKREILDEATKNLKQKYNVNIHGYILDLRNREQAESMFSDLDKKGVFVSTLCLNSADMALAKPRAVAHLFFEVTPEYVEYILQANVVGNFRLIKLAAERMHDNGGGAIVFISSNSAHRPNMHRVPYITSKGGINAMSKSLAVDLGKYGIRSNVILP